jgi:hypothetical protein
MDDSLAVTPALDTLFPRLGGLSFLRSHWRRGWYAESGDVRRFPQAMLEIDFDRISELVGKDQPGDGVEVARQLQDVDVSDALGDFFAHLRHEIGAESGAFNITAWSSKPSAQVPFHYDTHDTLIIQLRGRKRLHLAAMEEAEFPDVSYRPTSHDAATEGVPPLDVYALFGAGFPPIKPHQYETVELLPGSVLSFSRGTWHASNIVSNDASLSMNVVHIPNTVGGVVSAYLKDRLRRDVRWRHPIEHRRGHRAADAQARVEACFTELRDLLTSTSIGELVDAAIMHTLPPLERRVHRCASGGIQRVPGSRLVVHAGADGALELRAISTEPLSTPPVPPIHPRGGELLEGTLTIPERYRNVLAWIEGRVDRYRVRDLMDAFPDLLESSIIELIESLVQMHVLVLLP